MNKRTIALADSRPSSTQPAELIDWAYAAESELRRLVAENAYLKAHTQELEAMLDAVGAGGVEPLRSSKSNHFVGANKTIGAPSRWLTTV